MQLRDTAARQREQALRPFVLVRHELNHTFVENLGQAPALGVSIGDLTFGDEEHRLGIRFPKQVPVLRAGERLPIEAVSTYNDRAIENVSAVVHLIPRYATFSLDLHITFRSIEGKTFSLVQTTEPNLEVIHGFREASDRSSRSRR